MNAFLNRFFKLQRTVRQESVVAIDSVKPAETSVVPAEPVVAVVADEVIQHFYFSSIDQFRTVF